MDRLRSAIAGLLVCVLLAPVAAQNPALRLNIVIVEGDGAINNLKQRVAREPIVQVEDENRRPVAGALVTFTLPGSGPGGSFPGGVKVFSVTTDSQGLARAPFQPDGQGQFQIRVEASINGQTASTTINQTNAGRGFWARHWRKLAIAGGVVVLISILATRGDEPNILVPGTPTVGGPR